MRSQIVAAAALLLTACSARPAPPAAPKFGAFGLDLTAGDARVGPGDNFFRFANGHWQDTHQIPPDRTRWGSFDELSAEAETAMRQLIESLPRGAEAGSAPQKVGDYFRAYTDTDAIERAGLEPARAGLAAIAAARTHADVAALMGRRDRPVRSPMAIDIDTDAKNPNRYIVGVSQGGLGLPDREYYLQNTPEFIAIRAKYVEHVGRMLALAGQDDSTAGAKAILDLETRIARVHWPRTKSRERDLTYNLRTREDLERLAPRFPWAAMLEAAGLGSRREFVVAEIDAVGALGTLFTAVPVPTWRSYLTYHFVNGVSHVLPKAFDDESFDFYRRTLNGQQQQRERWKRGVVAVGSAVGEAAGQLYVERHFPAASKARMVELVENLRRAYTARITGLRWMSEETKKVAIEKLSTFRPKIGYPDRWRDYRTLEVRAGDPFGNAERAALFEWTRVLKRIDEPTDRDEWWMTPQTVNAYYNATFNEVVFPAAILQPPFFDPAADAAVNYGAIGAVIGHEMGHGFDDQGAKSDAQGVLRTWWKPEDEKRFRDLVAGLATQYDTYEALPGLRVNGQLTLGENIGDLGGLTVALEAYHLSLAGRPAPVLGGLTGDQRFFLSWAQCWRELIRDERVRTQVMSDPHSPARFRVNGVVRNMAAWYDAFGVRPGAALFLAPADRVQIW